MSDLKIREHIIHICQRLYQRNMLAACDGNVSYRLGEDEILITPSKKQKGFLKTDEFARIRLDGSVIEGKPSSESKMHLKVYQSCDEAKSVIHAHPPTAVAWSVAHPELKHLPNKALAELVLNVGLIPIVPFALPGTSQMATHLNSYLPEHRVMILARHGALSWGQDLDEAMSGMERIEHAAIVLKTAQELGGISDLPDDVYEELLKMRKSIGPKNS